MRLVNYESGLPLPSTTPRPLSQPLTGLGHITLDSAMKSTPQQTAITAIEQHIIEEIDSYNDAVESGHNELAQMIHLNIQSLKRKRERLLLLK